MDDISDQFIVKEDSSKDRAMGWAKRLIKFGRITKEGNVLIDDKSLSKGDQVKLALVIRYVGNCLNEEIQRKVRPTELVNVLGQRLEAIGSVLSGLVTQGFARKEGYGEYSAHQYKIDDFLKYLEEVSSNGPTSIAHAQKRRRITRVGNKNKTLTGIGVHIQRLIDEGFFIKPRLMSEVSSRLEEENIFRDERVVDTTIRTTFVTRRRVLQRIRNTEGGKARWLYVVRN